MYKDVFKFDNYITEKVDNVNEYVVMMKLFKFYNVNFGYSFPSYEELMLSLHTSSRNRVSRTLKSLVDKGLLFIEKIYGKNNKYYITGIENFITTTAGKKDNDPVEEVNEVEEVEEVEDERIIIAENTITIGKVTKKLRELLLNTDTETVKKAIENVKDKTIVTANYFYNAINLALDKVKTTAVKYNNNAVESVKGFNNFTGREYSAEQYADLEAKLFLF